MTRVPIKTGLLLCALTAVIVMTPSQAAAQDAKQGEGVYNAQKCSVCHVIAGKGSNKANPLDGVGAKLSAADIRAWIVDPVAMTKKTASTKKPPMPSRWASLPAADLDGLVAYMQSLK